MSKRQTEQEIKASVGPVSTRDFGWRISFFYLDRRRKTMSQEPGASPEIFKASHSWRSDVVVDHPASVGWLVNQ